jgi:hypothetical protein
LGSIDGAAIYLSPNLSDIETDDEHDDSIDIVINGIVVKSAVLLEDLKSELALLGVELTYIEQPR